MTKIADSADGLAAEMERLLFLTNDGLRKRWSETFGTPPPKYLSRDLLLRCMSYRIQEKALGGLKPATKRRLLKLAERLQAGGRSVQPTPQAIKPGTRLLREWQGVMHSVTVVEGGFEYQGRRYRHLSRIACEITGARWSGPRFFNVGGNHQNMAGEHAR